MPRNSNRHLLSASALIALLAASPIMGGCEDDVDDLDDVVDEAGDAVDDAADEIDDAIDDAGDSIDDAADEAGDSVDSAVTTDPATPVTGG